MATKFVTSPSRLVFALKTAKGGDTILLADGDYGSVILDTKYLRTLKAYDEKVTIAALNPLKARFDSLDLRSAANLVLDGLGVTGDLDVWYGSRGIDIRNSQAGLLWIRDAAHVTVTGNDLGGGNMALILQSSSHVTVRANHIHDAAEDLVRILGDSRHVRIEDNLIADTHADVPTHPDLVQVFGADGRTPSDITIRGNILHDDPATGSVNAQGIFFNGPGPGGYRNILIEQNLIAVPGHLNTIYMRGGEENVALRDNTLLGQQHGYGGTIRLAAGQGATNAGVTVEGNVARRVLDETQNSRIGDNHFYGKGASYRVGGDLADLFASPDYRDWRSLLPVAGSAVDWGSPYGAQARMQALLAGEGDSFGPVRQVFARSGTSRFSGNTAQIVTAAHQEALATGEGTIALRFNADTTGWKRGLISKDSAGLQHGFGALLDHGRLVVSFEDAEGRRSITGAEVAARTGHDLVVSFEAGRARVYLDGALIGEVATGMDWRQNDDPLMIGGDNGESARGTASAPRYNYDGTVSDLRIYDEGMSAAALLQHEGAGLSLLDGLQAGRPMEDVVYYHDGIASFDGTGSATITVPAIAGLAMPEGTVVMNFSADTLHGKRALIARDSAGSGNGFWAAIDRGILKIGFEDGQGVKTLARDGLSAGTDYALVISFEGGIGRAYLNGELIGEVATGMDWTRNADRLVIGADNGSSPAGTTAALRHPYDGTITGVLILDEGMTAQEVFDYSAAHPLLII